VTTTGRIDPTIAMHEWTLWDVHRHAYQLTIAAAIEAM
jgi:hypothetical protein